MRRKCLTLSFTLVVCALVACAGSTTTPRNDGGTTEGGTSDGGTESDGGGGADGSASCSSTPTTFNVDGTGSFCDNPTPCGDLDWLTIRKDDGTPLAIKTCPAVGCASQPRPIALPATATWDGSYYTNCSDVHTLTCAPAGHYIAHLCLYVNQADAGSGCVANPPVKCKDVPFDWPASAPISGTLP